MEMVLVGMGGCTAFDVMLMLQKSRQHVTSLEVTLDSERADEIPAVFTKIEVHFKFVGRGLSAKHVERAVKLSADKYCSVSKMLESTAEIVCTWDIEEDGAEQATQAEA